MAQANIRDKRTHYIEYFLPFMMLLAPYKFGPVTVDAVGLMMIALFVLSRNKWRVRIQNEYRPFLYFLLYIVIRDLARMLLGPDPLQTQVNRMVDYLAKYVMVLIICNSEFDEDKLYSTWKIAGTIFSIGLFYHIMQLYFFGQRIVPISLIPGYLIRPDAGIASGRPCSFFPEPASFASAMLPLVFLALKKSNLKVALISTIVILASTSTVGIILSIVLWSVTFLQRDLRKRTKVLMLFATIGIIYVFANLDLFEASFSKLLLAAQGGSTFGSRVRGSFEIVGAETWLEKIFGTNYNDVNSFIATHSSLFDPISIVQIYWRGGEGNVFLNTFGQLFFGYGLVGFLLYINPLIGCLRKRTYQAKAFVIMVLVAMFGQTMLLNSYYFMNILIIILFSKTKVDDLGFQYNHGKKDKVSA